MAALVLLAACGGEGDRSAGPASTKVVPTAASSPPTTVGASPPTSAPATTNTCTSRQRGFRVSYPLDWFENHPNQAPRCSWFHPERFDVPQGTDVVNLAVRLYVRDNTSIDEIAEDANSPLWREVSREEAVLGGRRVLRIESEQLTNVGLYWAGYRVVSWHVDLGDGRMLVGRAGDDTYAGTRETNAAVAREMVASVDLLPAAEWATCSAADLRGTPMEQPGLPAAVAATRAAIVAAATACDYEALAALAARGAEGFLYSFGESGDPAGSWRDLEGSGDEVLHALVAVLDLPHATRTQGTVEHVWPSAFAYDSLAEVPDEELGDLWRCYCGANTSGADPSESYDGSRVGISDTGTWLYFVEAD